MDFLYHSIDLGITFGVWRTTSNLVRALTSDLPSSGLTSSGLTSHNLANFNLATRDLTTENFLGEDLA